MIFTPLPTRDMVEHSFKWLNTFPGMLGMELRQTRTYVVWWGISCGILVNCFLAFIYMLVLSSLWAPQLCSCSSISAPRAWQPKPLLPNATKMICCMKTFDTNIYNWECVFLTMTTTEMKILVTLSRLANKFTITYTLVWINQNNLFLQLPYKSIWKDLLNKGFCQKHEKFQQWRKEAFLLDLYFMTDVAHCGSCGCSSSLCNKTVSPSEFLLLSLCLVSCEIFCDYKSTFSTVMVFAPRLWYCLQNSRSQTKVLCWKLWFTHQVAKILGKVKCFPLTFRVCLRFLLTEQNTRGISFESEITSSHQRQTKVFQLEVMTQEKQPKQHTFAWTKTSRWLSSQSKHCNTPTCSPFSWTQSPDLYTKHKPTCCLHRQTAANTNTPLLPAVVWLQKHLQRIFRVKTGDFSRMDGHFMFKETQNWSLTSILSLLLVLLNYKCYDAISKNITKYIWWFIFIRIQ